jgi:hypothetical protein
LRLSEFCIRHLLLANDKDKKAYYVVLALSGALTVHPLPILWHDRTIASLTNTLLKWDPFFALKKRHTSKSRAPFDWLIRPLISDPLGLPAGFQLFSQDTGYRVCEKRVGTGSCAEIPFRFSKWRSLSRLSIPFFL